MVHRRELGRRREHDGAVCIAVLHCGEIVEDGRRAGLHRLVTGERGEDELGVDGVVGAVDVGEEDRDRHDVDREPFGERMGEAHVGVGHDEYPAHASLPLVAAARALAPDVTSGNNSPT